MQSHPLVTNNLENIFWSENEVQINSLSTTTISSSVSKIF